MSKHTKRQVNELCFPTCVLLSSLSPQFVFYFLVGDLLLEQIIRIVLLGWLRKHEKHTSVFQDPNELP